MLQIEAIQDLPNSLGESPIWDHRDNRLYWVDSLQCKIFSLDPIKMDLKVWDTPDEIGSIGLRMKGGFITALRSGFAFFSPTDGSFTKITDPEPNMANNRLNDGKVDAHGRFWCGSVSENLIDPVASLYCLGFDLTVTCHETDIVVSNGLAWSPDTQTMYFADSPRQIVYAYDFEKNLGKIQNRRKFIDFSELPGRPDGATVDEEGYYWSAMIRGGCIGRFSTDGILIEKIPMPIEHPTMCIFGGENFDTIYVTSGTCFLNSEERRSQPQAGKLFAIKGHKARGLPEPMFMG